MLGCSRNPPSDVAHVQFRSRIAFKLVWVPPAFTSFVLVDDLGQELARGRPVGRLPPFAHREANFRLTSGSKYASAAMRVSEEES